MVLATVLGPHLMVMPERRASGRGLHRMVMRITAPVRSAWDSSIRFRLVALTLTATILVVLLGGQLLLTRAGDGIVEAKKQFAATEASVALQRMQTQLNDTDMRTESVLERLGQLADEVGGQGTQYSLFIETPTSSYISRGMLRESVPLELLKASDDGSTALFVTATQVLYVDGRSVPGVVVAGHLVAPNQQEFPTYFVFPATSEIQTLTVLHRALWVTASFLVVALGMATFWIAHQVTVPVRQAAEVAARIASGDLDQRMAVRRHDEMASLGSSMNNMAGELERQIRALENLSAVQRQFVSDVSHELRTPMTTMRMATEVLHEAREDFDPHLARSVELLHDQEERFEEMLADLLEISRFDAGAAVLSVDAVDLVDLVNAEVVAQQGVAEKVGIPVEVRATEPVVVEVDARRVTRIIRNLLSNALSHGDESGVMITIAGDAQVACLTVRDHGVGFAPEAAELVFRRFWRADESRQRVLGGTGLGLAIALEDARLHKGWLEAWGQEGEGAQFRLTLPRKGCMMVDHAVLDLEPGDR